MPAPGAVKETSGLLSSVRMPPAVSSWKMLLSDEPTACCCTTVPVPDDELSEPEVVVASPRPVSTVGGRFGNVPVLRPMDGPFPVPTPGALDELCTVNI